MSDDRRQVGEDKSRRARKEVSGGGVVFRRAEGTLWVLLIRDGYGHWGFPKGHLERGESAKEAAVRETIEETGLGDLVVHAPVETIDWFFRLDGRLIHKYCHFFLLEAPTGEPVPQRDEGITECEWLTYEAAMARLGYENARGVLRRAGELMAGLPS